MEIPDKVFFKIGEVSDLAGVKTYVLRYWESEFSIAPHKSTSGQRLYRRKDIEKILLIKRLLYAEGFTIAGARKYLAKLNRADRDAALQDDEDMAVDATSSETDRSVEGESGQSRLETLEGAIGDEIQENTVAPKAETTLTGSLLSPAGLTALKQEILELQSLIRSARAELI